MLNILFKRTTPKLFTPTFRGFRTFAVVTKFTKEHEWIKYDDQSKEATFGITDYAQKELGDIVFIDLPFKGDTFNAGEAIGAVESVKTSAQIYIPAGAEIIENNSAVQDNPAVVNQDPLGEGWISKVKVTDDANLQNLMSEEDYKKYVEGLE